LHPRKYFIDPQNAIESLSFAAQSPDVVVSSAVEDGTTWGVRNIFRLNRIGTKDPPVKE
jgi:hypothetical protein